MEKLSVQEHYSTPAQVVRVDQFVCVLPEQLTVTHICAPGGICQRFFFVVLQLLVNYIDCPKFGHWVYYRISPDSGLLSLFPFLRVY